MPINLGVIQVITAVVGLLVAITIHEYSHALAAKLLGDRTAERMGRLSLNPLVHLDPLGTFMMFLTALSGIGIGWGKPTPVNAWNLRPGRRLGMGLVAAAGPLSNITLAVVLAILLRLLPGLPMVARLVMYGVLALNLGLAAFNLLPLPILDGFHVLMGAITSIRAGWAYDLSYKLERIEPHGPMILLVLIMLGYFVRVSPLMLLTEPIYRALSAVVGLIL